MSKPKKKPCHWEPFLKWLGDGKNISHLLGSDLCYSQFGLGEFQWHLMTAFPSLLKISHRCYQALCKKRSTNLRVNLRSRNRCQVHLKKDHCLLIIGVLRSLQFSFNGHSIIFSFSMMYQLQFQFILHLWFFSDQRGISVKPVCLVFVPTLPFIEYLRGKSLMQSTLLHE